MKSDQYLEYESVIKGFPLFSKINSPTLRALLYRLTPNTIDNNLVLLNSTKPTSRFHIVVRGRIKVYTYDLKSDRELTLFILRGGDCFDIFTLFGQSRYQMYYKTLESSEVLSCPINYFHDWLPLAPNFNAQLTEYILRRMARLQEAVIDMVLADTATRLLKLLWRHTNLKSKRIECINDLSDKELASLIGTTRAVMNRHLQVFKEEGILKKGRNKIELSSWELLEAKVHKVLPNSAYAD